MDKQISQYPLHMYSWIPWEIVTHPLGSTKHFGSHYSKGKFNLVGTCSQPQKHSVTTMLLPKHMKYETTGMN